MVLDKHNESDALSALSKETPYSIITKKLIINIQSISGKTGN